MSILERLGHRSRVAQHVPTRGLETEVTIARLDTGDNEEPVEQLLTVDGLTAKGATSITLTSALTGKIRAKQYLNFYDSSTGAEYICKVTATAASGASALTVEALPEAIPDTAKGEYPPVLWDLTDASADRSYNRAAQPTFHTGGYDDGVITGGSVTISLPTIYSAKNAAGATLALAGRDGAEVWTNRELNIPSTAYSKGKVLKGRSVVTANPDGSSVDGFVSEDYTLAFQGQPIEVDPVAT